MNPVKQVIIIRNDLNMRKGKMCSQAAHASMKVFFDRMNESGDSRYEIGPEESWCWEDVVLWIDGSFTKIVVSCNSEQELKTIYENAVHLNLPASIIHDNGLTEFGGVPTYTAVAIGPAKSSLIDTITKNLRLL